jgi:hypothetical protein
VADEIHALEVLEAGGKQTGADAGEAVEQVLVALGSRDQLPDHEQRPALSDQVECSGGCAELVVGASFHV